MLSLHSSLSTAQNTTNTTNCPSTYSDFGLSKTSVNASAAYPVPGFYPPGTGTTPPANWTYNTAVSATSNNGINQAVWIDTPDNTNLESVDLPYLGCLVAFIGLPHDTTVRGQDDSGDCVKAMDRKCVDDVTMTAKSIARQASGTDREAETVCASIVSMSVPNSCSKYTAKNTLMLTGSVVSARNSTNPNGTSLTHPSCPLPAPTHPPSSAHLSWSTARSPTDNTTAYDRALTRLTPVITAVWAKNGTQPAGEGWSDARLVCMRARDVRGGSRVPKGVPKDSGAAGGVERGWGMVVVGLVVGVVGFGWV
ncbi:hypothetical protein Q9189_006710 [Teloschistes chrysophthalmus]